MSGDASEVEIVDAELVEDSAAGLLSAGARRPAQPLIDLYTILRPGQILSTEADRPAYTAADFYVSEETARRLEEQAGAFNTQKNYRSQRAIFARWCREMGRIPFPCTTATFVEYVAHMIACDYAPSSIKAHMSAIRTWQPEDRQPGTRDARGMVNEHAKSWNRRNRIKKAPAITDAKLRAMVATCSTAHPIDLRDRCLLLIGRGALNRRSELAGYLISDIEVEDEGVPVRVGSSKGDQAAHGAETFVPAWEDPLLDPVRACRDWAAMLHRLGRHDGPLFIALTAAGSIQNRETAIRNGDHLSGDAINNIVRARARKADLPEWWKHTSHGLRRGGAQVIADAGGDPTDQGRWKPGSAVVKREYLDRARDRNENPWLGIAQPSKPPAAGAG